MRLTGIHKGLFFAGLCLSWPGTAAAVASISPEAAAVEFPETMEAADGEDTMDTMDTMDATDAAFDFAALDSLALERKAGRARAARLTIGTGLLVGGSGMAITGGAVAAIGLVLEIVTLGVLQADHNGMALLLGGTPLGGTGLYTLANPSEAERARDLRKNPISLSFHPSGKGASLAFRF